MALGSEVACHSAQEGVTGSCRVGEGFKRVGGAAKNFLGRGGEEHGSEFAELDDDVLRPFFQEDAPGFDEVVGAGEFAGLAFVQHEDIELGKDLMEALVGDADPQVHGIGDDEGAGMGALGEHFQLIVRRHVREDDERGAGNFRWKLDLPIFEDIEAHVVGGALVHVGVVFAGPGEGFAFGALNAGEVHAVVFQHLQVLLGEIMADDADEIDGAAEEGGGECGVGGGSAEEILGLCFGSFDMVDGDGAADDDAWGRVGHDLGG